VTPPRRRSPLPQIGQSIGSPGAGALYGGDRLHRAEHYLCRNPKTTFGTTTMVEHIRTIARSMRARFPDAHPLLVGDLSTELGGPIGGHFSHQSGRDVDLAPYYRTRHPGFPRRFAAATRDNLDFAATFALLEEIAATQARDGGVEWVLLDYGVQRMLVEWGREHGIDEATLAHLFQYPRGPRAPAGIVRHMPEHGNHLHVRFRCAAADRFCASPPYPPTRASRLAQRRRPAVQGDESLD